MKDLLQTDKPLYLAKGSVRAILALGVVAAFIAGQIDEAVALLVLGAYFGQRGADRE
jgi:hypothetical protein